MIVLGGAYLFYTDGRTDGQTDGDFECLIRVGAEGR